MTVTLTIPQVIARLQHDMPDNKLVMRVCDELLRRLYKETDDMMKDEFIRRSKNDGVVG